MADPLALYASVMGKLWEDQRIRGRAAARIDARIAGRRQGRSFGRVGSMSARNVAKAASGQSRAAVFKRIRAGGCKTQSSLGNQLAYINDKAVYTYSTMTNALTDDTVLSEDQKSDIIEAWAETWRGSTKLGFTSHMLLPHVMMVAPTRAGKGVGFVIPNLLSFAGSLVVLDVKGENFEKTSRLRALNGDEVYRFSPFDWANATHRYNPLARIAKAPTFAQRFTEVSILADLFLDKDNKTLDTFSEAGKSIFVAACLLAIQRGTPNLGEVNKIVAGGEYKNAQYKTYADEAEETILRELWTNAASASSRLLTSNIQALMTAGLKQWDNPAVRSATQDSDFDFVTFRKAPQSLYIAVSEDHIATLAPLLRLMFADLIASIRLNEPGPDEPWPVMMMIDEFQQMGAMPYLERAIHSLAGYGGRVAMIAQSLASLDRIYGPEGRESLENGAGLKLYITPRDQRTVKEVSAAVGSTTREAVTRMYGRNKGILGATSTSARLEERPLLSETEARLMDPDEVIILASPQHPIKAQRIKYYDDPFFKGMVAKQDGNPFPYPPSVEGVGPWGAGEQVSGNKEASGAVENAPVRDRSERREARAMRVMSGEPDQHRPSAETLERQANLPKDWETRLARQGDFIEDLLGP